MRSAIAGMVLATLAGSTAFAQAAGETGKEAGKEKAKLEFEVASIKASAPMGNGRMMMGWRGGPGTNDPGRITGSNLSLQMMITNAYGVKHYQVIGGPSWLDTEHFDVTAKVPEGASKDDVKIMWQNLLAERFKLTVHHDSKEMPIYALTVGKNGAKLKESTVSDAPPPQPKEGNAGAALPLPRPGPPHIGSDGCPELPAAMTGRPMNMMMMSPNGACMVVVSQSMQGLADQLSFQFDRPVLDMTELKGKFDFKLRYDPGSMPGGRGMPMMMMAGPPPGGGPPGVDGSRSAAPEREPAPSIFAAMQEQLGLKLDPRKGQVDLVVIDHIERTPTEN